MVWSGSAPREFILAGGEGKSIDLKGKKRDDGEDRLGSLLIGQITQT